MFGAVCSGRPMQLAQQVEPTKFVFSIENATNLSHVAAEIVDANFMALVYFQLPGLPEFKLLGGLNVNKPSSIFKLHNPAGVQSSTSHALDDDDIMNDVEIPAGEEAILNIGISIEPLQQAEVLLLQEKSKQKTITLPQQQAAQRRHKI
ncbi:hypothetical protein HF325_005958 [Metschnikowia pulcherrima]|uniref:Hikeshi-like N-terminal domain-containing protein n=1 Tax=Metschnikowia pulcherrima TaxID=27326 RepID=A0A8H7GLP8_9ASCO|nr:hypothetical protein HF325_005958 [Metschnikowia pulcherrima]